MLCFIICFWCWVLLVGRFLIFFLNFFVFWCFEFLSGLFEIVFLFLSSVCGFGLLKIVLNVIKNCLGLFLWNYLDFEEFGLSGFLLIEKRFNLVSGFLVFRFFFLFNFMFVFLEEWFVLIFFSVMCINYFFR